MVRYPGGNFVSAYNWEDGVGPREQRPTRLDLAWHTSDSNAVGVHEFIDWCDTVGTQTDARRSISDRAGSMKRATSSNTSTVPTGSYWGDLRKKNGRAEPFDVKLWCLGNEMDGPWQVGHEDRRRIWPPRQRDGEGLARLRQIARADRLRLVAIPTWRPIPSGNAWCSSTPMTRSTTSRSICTSQQPKAPTHAATQLSGAERQARPLHRHRGLDHQLREGARRARKKDVTISFDEWNVWYHSNKADREVLDGNSGWPHAPRLLEDIYNFEDVLQVGCILNTFIRRSDVVQHRVHRAAGQRHRPDHDRARRTGLEADDLLSVLLRFDLWPRHRAQPQCRIRRATTRTSPTTSPISTFRACTTKRPRRSPSSRSIAATKKRLRFR